MCTEPTQSSKTKWGNYKKNKFALAGAGIAATLAIVILFVLGASSHSISIDSSPAGAEVLLDDMPIGKTPLTYHEMDSGKHKLVIRKKGYKEFRAEIDSVESAKKTISATLISQDGYVNIASYPSGATIELDGRLVGSTPLNITNIKSGEHSLKLQLKDYTVYAENFSLAGNETKKIFAKMQYNLGSVYVDSTPQGANILLDGKEMGKTPLTISKQPQGEHLLKLTLESFASQTKTINIAANATTRVDIRLKSRQKIRLSLPRRNIAKGDYVYFLSHEKYLSPSNFMESVKVRYGKDVELVDWNEIKKQFQKGLPAFLNGIGIRPRGSALVSWKGKIKYAPDRGYFIARLDGRAPRKFQTHDEINNYYLALSSWKTRNQALLRAPRY